ncbi:MAG: hypothetical protein IKS53_09630, partial [Bacteroidales bacterium]|nr:hypothetical protein [Bacteroidales bacterium]
YINAEITNSKGELCNEGEAIYFLMNQEKAKEMGFIHCEVEEYYGEKRKNMENPTNGIPH